MGTNEGSLTISLGRKHNISIDEMRKHFVRKLIAENIFFSLISRSELNMIPARIITPVNDANIKVGSGFHRFIVLIRGSVRNHINLFGIPLNGIILSL